MVHFFLDGPSQTCVSKIQHSWWCVEVVDASDERNVEWHWTSPCIAMSSWGNHSWPAFANPSFAFELVRVPVVPPWDANAPLLSNTPRNCWTLDHNSIDFQSRVFAPSECLVGANNHTLRWVVRFDWFGTEIHPRYVCEKGFEKFVRWPNCNIAEKYQTKRHIVIDMPNSNTDNALSYLRSWQCEYHAE